MANGFLHMFCRFHSAKLLLQKPNSGLASVLMVSLWNQDFWWFSKTYKLTVINLATRPKVICMECWNSVFVQYGSQGISQCSYLVVRDSHCPLGQIQAKS